jgi:hypothetical protein
MPVQEKTEEKAPNDQTRVNKGLWSMKSRFKKGRM